MHCAGRGKSQCNADANLQPDWLVQCIRLHVASQDCGCIGGAGTRLHTQSRTQLSLGPRGGSTQHLSTPVCTTMPMSNGMPPDIVPLNDKRYVNHTIQDMSLALCSRPLCTLRYGTIKMTGKLSGELDRLAIMLTKRAPDFYSVRLGTQARDKL